MRLHFLVCHPEEVREVPKSQISQRIPLQLVLKSQNLKDIHELSLPSKSDFKVFLFLKCLIIISLNFKTRGHLNWKIDFFFSPLRMSKHFILTNSELRPNFFLTQ